MWWSVPSHPPKDHSCLSGSCRAIISLGPSPCLPALWGAVGTVLAMALRRSSVRDLPAADHSGGAILMGEFAAT